MSTYEFSSFRAMNDHLHNAPAIRGRKPEPWLPAGPNPSHFRTLGLSSKEEVAAIATKSQEEVEREGVETTERNFRLGCRGSIRKWTFSEGSSRWSRWSISTVLAK